MKKNSVSNASRGFQIIVAAVCVGILALLGYLRIFGDPDGGEGAEGLTGQYLTAFFGFGSIVFGALSAWAVFDLIEKRGKGAVSVYRLILFGVGLFYFLYKLSNLI